MKVVCVTTTIFFWVVICIVLFKVKLAKVRKKGEKVISDSQERAYWRVHRPPPGTNYSLEQRPLNIKTDKSSKDVQKTIPELKQEVV